MRNTPTIATEADELTLTGELVEQIAHTGLTIATLLDVLLEELPDDAFPGEVHRDVLMEMLTNSIRPAAEAAGPEVVAATTDLLAAVVDWTVHDLRAATELARARGDHA